MGIGKPPASSDEVEGVGVGGGVAPQGAVWEGGAEVDVFVVGAVAVGVVDWVVIVAWDELSIMEGEVCAREDVLGGDNGAAGVNSDERFLWCGSHTEN